MRSVNQATLDLIKSFEGCSLAPYKDLGGVWTIGYGHIKGVTSISPPLTQEEASLLFIEDVNEKALGVEKLLKVQVNDNEFGALVSFAFNLGLSNLSKSTLLNCINLHNIAQAGNEFLRWNKVAGRIIAGLTRRRQAEKALFLKA